MDVSKIPMTDDEALRSLLDTQERFQKIHAEKYKKYITKITCEGKEMYVRYGRQPITIMRRGE